MLARRISWTRRILWKEFSLEAFNNENEIYEAVPIENGRVAVNALAAAGWPLIGGQGAHWPRGSLDLDADWSAARRKGRAMTQVDPFAPLTSRREVIVICGQQQQLMSPKSGAVCAPGQRPFPFLGEAGVFPASSFLCKIPRHGWILGWIGHSTSLRSNFSLKCCVNLDCSCRHRFLPPSHEETNLLCFACSAATLFRSLLFLIPLSLH